LSTNTAYKYNMLYDPSGGGEGIGKLTVTMYLASDNSQVGVPKSVTLANESWALNGFGYTMMNGTNDTGGLHYYLDNVSYTAVPEPSVLAMLAVGMVSLLAYAWRKRK